MWLGITWGNRLEDSARTLGGLEAALRTPRTLGGQGSCLKQRVTD